MLKMLIILHTPPHPTLSPLWVERALFRSVLYGQPVSGGRDIRIASTLPPVFRPKMVPRS